MYQAAVQALLGLQPRGHTIEIDPCILTAWSEYLIEWHIGGTHYRLMREWRRQMASEWLRALGRFDR